jgi:hypothetical protein
MTQEQVDALDEAIVEYLDNRDIADAAAADALIENLLAERPEAARDDIAEALMRRAEDLTQKIAKSLREQAAIAALLKRLWAGGFN